MDEPPAEPEPDIVDVFEELEELEDLVDSPAEREQVRETMKTLHRSRGRRLGRLREGFDIRDMGEALVGGFVFGIPMIVEDGTLAIGAFVARHPPFFALTALLGVAVVLGILHAVEFERVREDLLFGVVPVRLLGVLGVAYGLAALLMTIWGRVDWATPWVATSQVMLTATVAAVGASLGDVLPET